MKFKGNIYLIIILILAIFLRLNYDIFINGYIFDEIAIVSVAKQTFPFEILKTASQIDYHAPLYYLIVHFFTYLDNEWVYLRLFNLILSLINVVVFYKIGKLISDKKLGYILALILTVNHLEIATVSFVKFYCLCFLLFSISIYYLIKIFKLNKGYKKFALTNFFFILSSTLGFIVVFIEYLVLILIKKDKSNLKFATIPAIGFLLYFPILLKQTLLNFRTIISPHASYSEFSMLSFVNFLNDYFSPLINYSCNVVTVSGCTYFLNFIESLNKQNIDYFSLFVYIIFSLFPILIGIFAVTYSIQKNKIAKFLNIFNLTYLLIFIFLTKLEITGFIPIYIYPCGLIMLISLGIGIQEIKNIKVKYLILIYFILVNLFISNCYPPEKRGEEAAKIFYCYEKYFKEHNDKNTHYIVTSGGRFLKKYYKDKSIFDFDYEKMGGSFDREYFGYLFGDDIKNKANKKNIKDLVQNEILNNIKNKDFEIFFNDYVLKNVNKGEKIVLSFSTDTEPFLFKKEVYKDALLNKKYYYHLTKTNIKAGLNQEIELDSSYIAEIISSFGYEYLIELLDKNFKRILIEQYTKTNKDDYIRTYSSDKSQYSTLWLAQNVVSGWVFVTYQKQ